MVKWFNLHNPKLVNTMHNLWYMSKLHTLVRNCECSINDDNFWVDIFLGFVVGKP
jgi:hypothetical protein